MTDTFNLFTVDDGINEKLLINKALFSLPNYNWVEDPKEAHFFLLPTYYEVAYEYSEQEYLNHQVSPSEKENVIQCFNKLIELANEHNKKIVVFYFRDPVTALHIERSVVFRTSLLGKSRTSNEFAMPAFQPDLKLMRAEDIPEYLPWKKMPSVGFRGQATSSKLAFTSKVRNTVNLFVNKFGLSAPLDMHDNFGYIHRRNAMAFLRASKTLKTDFTVTQIDDVSNDIKRIQFAKSIFSNEYNICASGFGNYSYRLYEVMSAGRIPVFINTDCILPFQEFIDWKNYVVWMEQHELHRIEKRILEFHYAHQGDKFIELQQKVRAFWVSHLSQKSFFEKVYLYLGLVETM